MNLTARRPWILWAFSLLMCLFLHTGANATIIKTNDLDLILNEIKKDPTNTVVVMDVGDVLLTAEDKILRHSNPQKAMLDKFYKDLTERYSKDEVQQLWSIMLLSRKATLVHTGTLKFIQEVKHLTPGVLCVTTGGIGKFGKIQASEQWRIDELRSLGLTFVSAAYPNVSSKELSKYLSAADSGCKPVCKDGILFVCNMAKANTLQAYLKVIGLQPKKIVFIDDNPALVAAVAQYCAQEHIDFAGFEYTAAKRDSDATFDPHVAELQFKTLEDDKIWLSDADAEKILKQRND